MRSHLMRTMLQIDDDVMQAALVVPLDRLGLPDPAPVCSGLAFSLFRSGSIPVVEGDASDLLDALAAVLAEVGEP